ncbi:MAG: hypothetical protein JW808_04290 [Victivallales bacterium]|nr:hypothetical protein [Victivallales bacterium]
MSAEYLEPISKLRVNRVGSAGAADGAPKGGFGIGSLSFSSRLIPAIAAVSVLINIIMLFRPESVLPLIKEVALDNDLSRVYFVVGLDNLLDTLPAEGNVLLRFEGFGQLERESQEDIPLLMYFRAAYKLYPRRVYVVSPEVVVNTGEDISANPFSPSAEWLEGNSVSIVISLAMASDGSVYSRVQSIGSVGKER